MKHNILCSYILNEIDRQTWEVQPSKASSCHYRGLIDEVTERRGPSILHLPHGWGLKIKIHSPPTPDPISFSWKKFKAKKYSERAKYQNGTKQLKCTIPIVLIYLSLPVCWMTQVTNFHKIIHAFQMREHYLGVLYKIRIYIINVT